MIKYALALSLTLGILAGVWNHHASAATFAEFEAAMDGGCPSGDSWIGPLPSGLVIPAIDRGDWTDYNGDGLLCFKVPPGFCGNRGQGEGAPLCGAYIWKDNDNPEV